jgi:hypothetical protein
MSDQNYFESPEYHQSFEYYLALIATGYTPDTAKKIVDGIQIFTDNVTKTGEGA